MKRLVQSIQIAIFLLSINSGNAQGINESIASPDNLKTILDAIWQSEQNPIRLRDAMIEEYGVDSKEAQVQQDIYKRNHAINELKVKEILELYGWPSRTLIGANGNRTICNVLQHSDLNVRLHYLPLMREAVKEDKLEARYLVRAEDRIATDRGELQIYGGQMKYYPDTKSFNVWPVLDPINIDKRRAEVGLEPIAPFLKRRFDFEWDLAEQIQRTKIFLENKKP